MVFGRSDLFECGNEMKLMNKDMLLLLAHVKSE